MFRRRLADADEGAVHRPFDPADAEHRVPLEWTIDVRIPPFVVLIDHRRGGPLQIELEHEVWSGIIPVMAVSDLDDAVVAVRAVDESFTGKPLRQITGAVSLRQPDIFGDEMERCGRRFLLT